LAKIAVNSLHIHPLAQGDGWTVSDILCNAGPRDRPFEERHSAFSIAIVAAGTFQYRSTAGRELMTPGSLLLGNAGQAFECGHEHGTGDRCLSFSYTPEFFERLASDAGARGAKPDFKMLRLPPLRELSPTIARANAALGGAQETLWEELSIQLAAQTVQIAHGFSPGASIADASAVSRVTRIVRMIDHDPASPHALKDLAHHAGLSPYHVLRTFQIATGLTPHQYLRRIRLRRAATRLHREPAKIIDIALDSGFEDISNFNRAFRAEFGLSPRAYRLLPLNSPKCRI